MLATTTRLRLPAPPRRVLVPAAVYGPPGQSFEVEADRASHLAVLAETEGGWTALHAPGASRLGYDAERLELAVEAMGPAHELAGPPGSTGFDTILREVYDRDRLSNPLQPWLTPDAAAQLAAEGLLRWHYREAEAVLVETADFAPPHAGRERMHVAWLSGAPTAYALLAHGLATGDGRAAAAGAAVLDTIAAGLAPCGAFWGQWTPEGWRAGWNGRPGRLHARTAAEATLFMLRAARLDPRPSWCRAVDSNLDFAMRSQSAAGEFPLYFDAETGRAESMGASAGMAWIPALAEAGGARRLRAAERAGEHYASFVREGLLFGAPEDVTDTPTSEDAYCALMAYVALAEATRDSAWLEPARHAAAWTFTWRWSHNLRFAPGTALAEHDFKSRGADLASPVNQHLHSYGLVCLPELLRLWRHTGDGHYLDRARDHLACFLQLVARHDGDFGARRGMVSERYFNARCYPPKGGVLPVSHAWAAGLLLYACTESGPYQADLWP